MGPGTKDILIKRGYLTDRSPYEEQERVRKMADIFHRRDKTKKSFLFLVAYDCNFRCPYCFENDISNNGKAWSKKVFTREMVDQAYRAMLELEPEHGAHIDTIILYGGEPLLKENRDIVAYMLEEGKKRGYNFNAVTNGYDLEHFTDLLGKDAINKLQITIDGSREKHDTRRTHYQTGNSFDKILMNMQVALDQGTTISVRINTDLNNFGELKLLQEEFEQRGFYRYKHFSTYSALIHGESEMSYNVVMSSETPSNSTRKVNTGQFKAVDYGRYIPDAQYINFDSEQERYLQDEPLPSALVFHDEAHNDLDQIHTINRGKYISKYVDAVKENPSMHMVFNLTCLG